MPVTNSAPLPSQNYFYRYNTEPDFPRFGQGGTIRAANGQLGCRLTDQDPRYQDFIFQRHVDAIKADIQLLHWAVWALTNSSIN